jgi:glycosyltransferase involved in cell wall biosynthesis
MTASLVRELRRRGHDASLLFVTDPHPLARELEEEGIPYRMLGYERGSRVLLHPRGLARAASELGPDGVVSPSPGYLPAALRLGGYGGPLVAVNHGRLLQLPALPAAARVLRKADRASGFWAPDQEVAVSDYLLERLQRERLHARRLVRIYNGIDHERYGPNGAESPRGASFRVAWAGRMIPGKGVDDLLRALALLGKEGDVRLVLAGDGPDRASLVDLASSLGLTDRVEFAGWVRDMPAFWRAAEIAVVPSHQFVESFGMVALEAMACARPAIVSRNGGLPEVVDEGKTGELFEPGDVRGLATAIRAYASDETKRREHGRQAKDRAARLFGIDRTAASYLELFEAN